MSSTPTIVIQPFAEPIPLAEAKIHIKQDADITTDDVLIASQLTACRDLIETETGSNSPRMKTIMATTFDLSMDSFQHGEYIQLPRVPVISVTSISYTDENGDAQTLATTVYTLDVPRGRLYLQYQQMWPITRWSPGNVVIRFVAGIAATFGGENTNTDMMTVYGRTLTNGDRVRLMNSGGALPTGLAALTDYFVVSASGSTFSLAATSGGAAVDLTAVGSGTQYLSQDLTAFVTLRNAILLALGRLYFNRGDGGGASMENTDRAIASLVGSQHA